MEKAKTKRKSKEPSQFWRFEYAHEYIIGPFGEKFIRFTSFKKFMQLAIAYAKTDDVKKALKEILKGLSKEVK